MTKTGLKFLSVIPSQKRLNWLGSYINSKEDALYGSVFAYQLVEAYLRGLIFWKTKDNKSTDVFGFKKIIEKFIDFYPQQEKLGRKLKTWSEKRNIIVHRLLENTKITNSQKLDYLIKNVNDNGLKLFLELKSVGSKYL